MTPIRWAQMTKPGKIYCEAVKLIYSTCLPGDMGEHGMVLLAILVLMITEQKPESRSLGEVVNQLRHVYAADYCSIMTTNELELPVSQKPC